MVWLIFRRLGMLVLCFWVSGTIDLLAQDKTDPAAEQFYSGNALYNRKLYLLAVTEYKQFLQKHPTHAKADEARWGIAVCYYVAGKYKEAEPALKDVIQRGKHGDKNRLLIYHGQCLTKMKKLPEAELAFAAVTSGTFYPTALASLTDTRFSQGKWPETMESAKKLMAQNPPEALARRGLYQAGYAARELKNWDEGIHFLEQLRPLVQEHALKAQAAYLLGECYREAKKNLEATIEYQVAAEGMKNKVIAAEVYYRLGFIQFIEKNYDEAITALGKCYTLDREGLFYDQATYYTGRSYLEKKDYRRTVQFLAPLSKLEGPRKPTRISKFVPKTPISEATLWLARTYSRQNNYAQAAVILTEAVTRFSRDPLIIDMYFDLGNAHMVLKKYPEATTAFTKVLAKADFPQRNDALRLQAACLHRQKNYTTSLTLSDEFLAKHPEDKLISEVLFIRAENLYLLKKDEEAVKAYQAYLGSGEELVSEDAARFRIGQLHYRKNDFENTLASIEPLVKKQPEGDVFSQLNFVAGDCHFRLKDWKQAAERLTVFVDKQMTERRNRASVEPNVDGALMQLAVCSMNTEDPKSALNHLVTLTRYYKASPHLPLALAEMGRLSYEAGNRTGARTYLTQFLTQFEKAPQRPQAEYYLGWINLDEKKKPEAEAHFTVVVSRYPKDVRMPDAALQLGIVQIEQEKYPEAQRTLTQLIRAVPEHPAMDRVVFELGLAYARGKHHPHAIKQFQIVVEKFIGADFADRAVYEWAWSEKALKRNDEAIKQYEFLLAKFPQSSLVDKVRTELAELTFGKKDYVKVIEQLKDTLANLKDKSVKENTTYRLGTAYFNNKDYDESAEIFESFVEEFKTSPKLASAYFQAGESRMKTREIIKARDHYLAATKVLNQPEIQESALMRLGETQGMTEQWRESSTTYALFLKKYPESQWAMRARFGMAWALQRQKAYPQAAAEYIKVIGAEKKDEWSAQAQFQLGECYFDMKQYDKAVQEFVRVGVNYKFKKWTASSILEMGRALEANKEIDRAKEQYQELIRKHPDHPAAQVAKGRLDALRRE